MKQLLAMVLATTVAYAGPDTGEAKRKVEPPADKLAAAAGEAFGKARAADERGDLDDAERLYKKALAIQPHPFTYYNLADVQRRRKDFDDAIKSYQKYLELDPTAKDRQEVEKLIVQLEALPGTMIIEIEESNAKVFLEGEPIKVAPVPDKRKPDLLTYTVDMPPGAYSVDVITAISHDNENCYVYRGSKRSCRLRLRPREDGNLIISGPTTMYRASMGYNGVTTKLKSRFAVDPGRQELWVNRDRQCKPMIVDVAKGDAITYVWADVPKKWPERTYKGKECHELKYKVRVLKF
jgi:tetratricopeptide (TPR) repeat protein